MKFAGEHYLLIMIFSLAFIIRSAFALQANDVPYSDASLYDSLGLSLSQGNGYIGKDGMPHSFSPPFYPFFLSTIYRLFGHNYMAVRIVQSLAGAFSCILIYFIGKKTYGVSAGIISSGISVIYSPFIKSAGLLLTELIFTFLLLLTVFYALKIKETQNIKYSAMLGLLSGISALTKSTMLFFPIFAMPVFLNLKEKNYLKGVKIYVVMLLFFGLSILPWTARNYIVYHKFVPIATQAGIGFYSSYCPASGVFGLMASGGDPAVIEANKISDPVSRSNFLVTKTLGFIKHNPKKVLILEFKKILYFWAPFDWEIVGGRWFNFIYAATLPFFAVGIFSAFKNFKKYFHILLPVVYFQAMSLIFYGSPRFRLPIEPFIFIIAAGGFVGLKGSIRRGLKQPERD